MKIRRVLLHYHVFKNAGSTVDWILERNFPGGYDTLHNTDPNGMLSSDEIAAFIEARPQLVALSSHHFRHPRPPHPTLQVVDIAFLRHPIERLASMYHYFQKVDPSTDPNAAAAVRSTLPEFLTWMWETQPYNMINSQTALFGNGGDHFFPPTPRQLERAVETIQDVRWLGVVDRFDESCVAAEYSLRPVFPTLDLSYVRQNVSRAAEGDAERRAQRQREQFGAALYERMLAINALDVALVEAANAELDRRLSHVPDVERRLAEFRQRCAELQAGIAAAEEAARLAAEEAAKNAAEAAPAR